MIKLKQNQVMKMHIPEFVCDHSPIGDHLNKYDMLSHLNSYSMTSIIGKPGSGKTSLLVGMLKGKGKQKIFRKCFNHILLVMPTSSRESMKDNIFKNLSEEKMYDELDLDSINSIYDKLLDSSAEKESTLLILDDVGASLKRAEIQTMFKRIVFNRRHLKCHIILLLQSFNSCPKELRKLFTNIFIYKPSKVEFENLFDELFETKKDMAHEIMNFVYDIPHQYLMLNIESQKMYKGFHEILIKKQGEEIENEIKEEK
jgi:DNA replication protein DnaC